MTVKRVVAGCFVVVVFLLGYFSVRYVLMAPIKIDRAHNKVVPDQHNVTAQARDLQATLNVADLHADSLLWKRDLLERSDIGHVDLPRLIEGHYALQVFSSVTKSPEGQNYESNSTEGFDTQTLTSMLFLQPVRTWSSKLERSLWHAEKLRSFVSRSGGRLRAVRTAEEIDRLLSDRQRGRPVVGGMLSVEGLHNLEGKIENLDVLYAAGFRMAGLTHFFDNEVAGSMHGVNKGGLTPFGRKVVGRMEDLGMVVDIAHASHATVADVLALATRPVVSSHTGIQAICKANRNLNDDELRGIARTGGVVGIGFWEGAICSTKPREVARSIAYVRDLVGIDHVGLGSDFDGATTTAFDASQIASLTQALLDIGVSGEDIRKIMGENVLRVLRAGLISKTR